MNQNPIAGTSLVPTRCMQHHHALAMERNSVAGTRYCWKDIAHRTRRACLRLRGTRVIVLLTEAYFARKGIGARSTYPDVMAERIIIDD